MNIKRKWAMPNKNTFTIKPIKELISKYINIGFWIDPFCNDSIFKKKCVYTNDLNPKYDTTHNLEALEFLKLMKRGYNVLFDPPYTQRQLKECYDSVGVHKGYKDYQTSFWSNLKKEISRIILPGDFVISLGYNSSGIGKKYGFEIVEILLVCHGSQHNDTIIVVEKKMQKTLF